MIAKTKEMEAVLRSPESSRASGLLRQLIGKAGVIQRLLFGADITEDEVADIIRSIGPHVGKWSETIDSSVSMDAVMSRSEAIRVRMGHEEIWTVHTMLAMMELCEAPIVRILSHIYKGLINIRPKEYSEMKTWSRVIKEEDVGSMRELEDDLAEKTRKWLTGFLEGKWFPYSPEKYGQAKAQLCQHGREGDEWGNFLIYFSSVNFGGNSSGGGPRRS